ncbi:MAG: 50S ribosomal protein L10, partial [Nitrososphaerales archaeon]
KPIQAGMSIHTALQEGVIYRREDLTISIDEVLRTLQASVSEALSLAVSASYATKESIEHLLRKAFGNARTLSVKSWYATDETAGEILYSAESKASALLEKAKEKGYS